MAAFEHRCSRITRAGQHNRGPWRPEEDDRLTVLHRLEDGNWTKIAPLMSTHRTPKQCRERWHQNLKPDLAHTPLTEQEQARVMHLVRERGHKWASIARSLGPHRSDNMVKNWWNGENNRRSRSKAKKRGSTNEGNSRLRDCIDQRRLPLPIPQIFKEPRFLNAGLSTYILDYGHSRANGRWSPQTEDPPNSVHCQDYVGEPLRPAMPSPVNSQLSNTAPSLVTDRASISPQPQQIETPRVPHLYLPLIPQIEPTAQRSNFAFAHSTVTRQMTSDFNSLPQPQSTHRLVGASANENDNSSSPLRVRSPKEKMRVKDILN